MKASDRGPMGSPVGSRT